MFELVRYSPLILFKVAANLKSEASQTYFSYLWWLLEPVLQMTVYYFAFGVLLRRGTDDFVVYLLVSIIPWLWFRRTVENSATSIIQNRFLIQQVKLPKIIFPAMVICQNTIKQLVVTLLLLGFLILYGINLDVHWMAIPVLLFVELCLICFCSFLVAAIVPFLPDLKYLVQFGLQMVMFCSGIFYSIDMIPPQYHKLFFINPMAVLLHNYRLILLYGQWPQWSSLLLLTIISIFGCFLVAKLMSGLDRVYPRVVS